MSPLLNVCVCVCLDPSATCSRYFWLNKLGHVPFPTLHPSPNHLPLHVNHSWLLASCLQGAVKTDQFVPFKPLFPHQHWQTVLLCRRWCWMANGAVQRELQGVSGPEPAVHQRDRGYMKWITNRASLHPSCYNSDLLNWPNVWHCPVSQGYRPERGACDHLQTACVVYTVCSAHESQGLMNFITCDSEEFQSRADGICADLWRRCFFSHTHTLALALLYFEKLLFHSMHTLKNILIQFNVDSVQLNVINLIR